VKQLSSYGDISAHLYLLENDRINALRVFDTFRATKLLSSLLEEECIGNAANRIKRLRHKWERKTGEIEKRALSTVFTPFVERVISHDETTELEESTRTAFSNYYNEALKANLTGSNEIDVARLQKAVPKNKLLCAAVITENHCKLILVASDLGGQGVIDHIDVDLMGNELLDMMLNDKDEGWLSTYKKFQDGLISSADEEILRSCFANCNVKLEEISNKLGSYIIQPLYNILRNNGIWSILEEIIFVPNGLLASLPIHSAKLVLDDQKKSEKFLIEEKSISLWPNLKAVIHYLEKTSSEKITSPKVMIVDGIEGKENHTPHYLSGEHSFAVEYIKPTEFKNFDKLNFLKSLSETNYTYFYCHGHWNRITPESSSLTLAENSTNSEHILTVDDLRHSSLTTSRLLFLAACESIPNEFIGLPVAIMEAGVASVVSTLWVAHSDVTSAIASNFYQLHLEDNLDPPEALRRSILENCFNAKGGGGNPQFNDLMFWAPFIIYGN